MKTTPPGPVCFVAMPFGEKGAAGSKQLPINFDKIFEVIRKSVREVGLECVRADFEIAGGFIHRQMYERLLIAEYVIADLTLANANVAYEVGVRHGSRAKATLLVCADQFLEQVPFDLRSLRIVTYKLSKKGKLDKEAGEELRSRLSVRLKEAIRGDLPPDNPIVQITAVEFSGRVHHEKTDVFLKRMGYVSEIGERVQQALEKDNEAAVAELRKLQEEVLDVPEVVRQLHTALVSIYLAYREKKAYMEMVDLFEQLPGELRMTPVAIEQVALALNRLAESSAASGDMNRARKFRARALRHLEQLPKERWSSETYGIAGRIYKGQSEAERKAGNDRAAEGALGQAIQEYETGFRLDPRDYYPGVNAITLRLSRNSAADQEALATLLPVVRFSVDRAPAPKDVSENYWQEATKLELACADRDWDTAEEVLKGLSSLSVEGWMRETTAGNLAILKRTFAEEPETASRIVSISDSLLAAI